MCSTPSLKWGNTHNRTCVDNCISGEYGKTEDRICYPCTSDCTTCQTPDKPSKCLSCTSPFYFDIATNTCNNNVCPTGNR